MKKSKEEILGDICQAIDATSIYPFANHINTECRRFHDDGQIEGNARVYQMFSNGMPDTGQYLSFCGFGAGGVLVSVYGGQLSDDGEPVEFLDDRCATLMWIPLHRVFSIVLLGQPREARHD